MSISVFVMTHKQYEKPEDPVYRTLQVGRAAGDKSLPYTGDDTGENISDKNCYYGELTGYYWIWKNYHKDDYIGICHYRRFFLNEENHIMSEGDFERILGEYDAIVSDVNISSLTNREGYGESHNLEDLLAVGRAIDRICPEYSKAFLEMLEAKTSHYANLFVTDHKSFDEYCTWLFAVLQEAAADIDVSSYDNYHKRVYGFLSELLLSVWLEQKGYRIYEAKIGITSEKSETVELKQKLAELVRQGEYTKSREVYYQYMKERPDVRLGQSDLSRELPVIECVLYILEQEKKAGEEGFCSVSEELSELVTHYRRLCDILTALGRGDAGEEMVQYLLSTHTTVIAVEVILRNTAGINGELVRKILNISGSGKE